MNVYDVQLKYEDGRNDYVLCNAKSPEVAAELVRVLLSCKDPAIVAVCVLIRRQL